MGIRIEERRDDTLAGSQLRQQVKFGTKLEDGRLSSDSLNIEYERNFFLSVIDVL